LFVSNEPSQNSLAVICAFTASVLKVAVNHTAFHRPLCGIFKFVGEIKYLMQHIFLLKIMCTLARYNNTLKTRFFSGKE